MTWKIREGESGGLAAHREAMKELVDMLEFLMQMTTGIQVRRARA